MRAQEVLRILKRNGFVERKAKGGHRQLVRKAPPPARLVTVPYHSRDIPQPILRKIATQAGKSPDEFC
jgi:predicted RNA binding protein YcfA (HicA-like mRNA interferase family)